jgi:putative DNA primase/helicase
VPCDDLYKAWKLWAEDNGHKPGSAQSFGRNLRAAIPELQTYRPREEGKQERRWYSGVSLKKTMAEHASHRGSGGGETQ